mgnify:CR=1 FL=1
MSLQSTEPIIKESLEDFSKYHENPQQNEKKKKNSLVKFLIYFLVVFVLTGLALFLSLKDNFNGVVLTMKKANVPYVLLTFAVIIFSYLVDGFAIFIFSRLYTRKYKLHQGVATSFIGAFYTSISPSKSAGQVMEVYTMNKQGVATSNAASIMVMSFIVYEITIILYSAVGLIFSDGLINTIGNFNILGLNIPSIPLIIIAFSIHLLIILFLFFMSYSRHIHNLILNHGINLLAKIKIIKKPEEKRESLRIQVENFKIELRRLCSNVFVFIFMIITFTLVLLLRNSIPYIAGYAFNGYGYRLNSDGSLFMQAIQDYRGGNFGYQVVNSVGQPTVASFFQGTFLTSFTQLMTSVIPIPGGAGISEYFFTTFFANYYRSREIATACQITWRFSSYLFIIIVAGIVTATYRASPKNEFHRANRHDFVTLQYQTFDERKASSDLSFEGQMISIKDLQSKFKQISKPKSRTSKEMKKKDPPIKKEKPIRPPKVKKSKEEKWDVINIKHDD